MSDDEDFVASFEAAIKRLEYLGYGLELSLIEKVRLRKILARCLHNLKKATGHMVYEPVWEACVQWMDELYGIAVWDLYGPPYEENIELFKAHLYHLRSTAHLL